MNDDRETVEQTAVRELRNKAKWHADRLGKHKNASLANVGRNTFKAEMIERGASDADGKQKPLRGKRDDNDQVPLRQTKVLNVGNDDERVKNGPEVNARSFAFR